ncbi:MAG: CapA family protein, partial [Lachnospiraceae bacterium]|nr:CapA family protein [Lachnospiraceae bacterium]
MKEIKKLSTVLIAIAFFVGFFFICNHFAAKTRTDSGVDLINDDTAPVSPANTVTGVYFEDSLKEYVKINLENEVRVTAVGDIMVYSYQLDYAYDYITGKYDFSKSFTHIKPYLDASDYVTGNLETTIAGQKSETIAISNGYMGDASTMTFNTPEQFLTDLKNAGFDLLTNANEQAFDYGPEGLTTTISNIDSSGLKHTGTFAKSDEKRYIISRIKGISLGFMAYTNVMDDTFSSDYAYMINYLDNYSEPEINKMCQAISEMKLDGAEMIIIALHFGDTYSSGVNDNQRALARRLCDAGADIILGSHPHVVEPMEIYETSGEEPRKCVIFYSLGNFLTSQQYQSQNGYVRDIGCMATFSIVKADNKVSLRSVDILPVYSDWTEDSIRVIPVTEVKDNRTQNANEFDYLDDERIE